jgi:hypothetical protein
MSEIENPQNPKSKRKTRGDQEEHGRPGNSAHELVEKNIK